MIRVVLTPALRASIAKVDEPAALPCGALVFDNTVVGVSASASAPTVITAPCERTPFYEAFSKYDFQPGGLSITEPVVSLPSMRAEAPPLMLFWPRATGRGGGFGRAYLNVFWIDDVRLQGGCRRKKSSERMRLRHRRRPPYELPAAKL